MLYSLRRQCLSNALPSRCPLCVCLESSVGVLGRVVPRMGTAPPVPLQCCRACVWLFGAEGPAGDAPLLGGDGLAELFCRGGSSEHLSPWSDGTLNIFDTGT